MKLERLNKVIEETDPERIRQYKLLGFVEEGAKQPATGMGREPAPMKPTGESMRRDAEFVRDQVKEQRRGRAAKPPVDF